jgi:DNA-binding MarR family transcriptional regulator
MQKAKHESEQSQSLAAKVIEGAREFSVGTVLFHQAAGRLLGVNVTDMKCLDIIVIKGSASPAELAAQTGLSSGATTAVIDRLERARLIQRRPHPTDRRGTLLVLTRLAMQRLPPLFESLANAMQALISGYSKGELAVLADFFAKSGLLWRVEREKLQRRTRPQRRRTSPRSEP